MKIGEILFGMFRYKRLRAAQIDGGMGAYQLQPFENPSLPMDALNGRGFHVRKQLQITSPAFFVPNAATLPNNDVTKIPLGEPDLLNSSGAGGLEASDFGLEEPL